MAFFEDIRNRAPWRYPRILTALACIAMLICLSTPSQAVASEPENETTLAAESLMKPLSIGFDSDSLAEALDAYLDENVAKTHEPGIAVAVVTSQGIAYLRTFGTCENASDAFYIGSLSKSMCAVAIMQLVEQGRIDLDAPACSYTSGYLISPDVTVRMLLNQTSGFGYYDSLNQATVGDSFGEFSYSNANYDLLGRIVEEVSGETYSDYLARHIFAPLNMIDSSAQGLRTNDVLGNVDDEMPEAFGDEEDTNGEMAYSDTRKVLGHRNYFGTYVQDNFQHGENDDAWGGPSSGYVSSSIRDMANYLQMYLDGGKNVIDSDSVMQIFMSRVPDPDGDSYYGMGWTSYYWDDELVFCHDGDVETNVASMSILPERGIGIVVLGDGYDEIAGNSLFFDLSNGILDIVMGYDAIDLDENEYETAHAEANAVWAKLWLICALPLIVLPIWYSIAKKIREKAGKGAFVGASCLGSFLFVYAIAWLCGVPKELDMPWRDISTFDPSIVCGLAIAIGLLAISMAARILMALITYRQAHGKTCEATKQITKPRPRSPMEH